MFAAAAALGSWKPRLGLDLQGGTRITLQASAQEGGVTQAKLDQAVGIISDRVNGAGVAEAEVTTQGDDIIIVEIPGKVGDDLERSIGSTAQLRFRLVAGILPPVGQVPTQPTPGTPTTPTDTSGTTSPGPTDGTAGDPDETAGSPGSPGQTQPEQTQGTAPTIRPPGDGSPTGRNRALADWFTDKTPTPSPDAETTPTDPVESSGPAETTGPPTETATPTEPPAETTGPQTESDPTVPVPTGPPTALLPPDLEQITDPYAWTQQPPPEWQAKLANFRCPGEGEQASTQIDIPSQPLLACDEDGLRYLLGPSMVEGTQVSDASAGIPQQSVNYVVNVEFDGEGADAFGEVTTRIAGTGQQLAIVLDGEVLSAPENEQPITGGRAEISGSVEDPFTQESASSLANSLKYGALPLTFQIQGSSNEGPELAGNQLRAGIIAGTVGLLLVVAYCLFYYRGLGLVVIASLLIAGLMVYASILLLGEAYGFTLTLPGIAGLIVAVGITADSFIVYFERLRDEVRDGRTLRTSVETGWTRARATILAADAVALLAAVVLFIFAIGVVKGFAFALGLTTLIDVFVVFFFTKPMVTMLARTKFFGQGHKLSGLDRAHLGMGPLPAKARTAGGEA
ncbi:MAG: protein translocase subunit SecD [Nocardioidaceae bacterium]|nr:protein translocase subunit SecD [Nocardioidaceae bacterium]